MSDFYYCISGSNDDILSVQDKWISWMAAGHLGHEDFQQKFTGSFASKSIEDYSPVWDEAKRCTYDTDKNPRYRYDGSTIQPKSNVKSIDYDSGSRIINDDGTLSWK